MVRKIFFLAATTALVSANAQNLEIDGHEAVDLGLSVLWATCNVGADSPEEIGDLMKWNDAQTWQGWGENWRLPNQAEMEELTSCIWTKRNDSESKLLGYDVKGKNGNSIFLPLNINPSSVNTAKGDYWVNSFMILHFHKTGKFLLEGDNTWSYGIRAVHEKPDASKLNYVEKENANTVYKTFENGQIVIIKNGVKYNLAGQKL